MLRILIIQTAFIGDVILATALLEKLHARFPAARIDFVLRKGNEGIFLGHPFLHEVLIWDKSNRRWAGFWQLVWQVRRNKYDFVVNLQRFFSSGLLTVLSGGRITSGFDKNPLSFLFSHRAPHRYGSEGIFIHETERNDQLISMVTDEQVFKPRLYPEKVKLASGNSPQDRYITVSPGSVWFTKQLPVEKWVEFIDRVGEATPIYLLGGKAEYELCNEIVRQTARENITNLAGSLSLLESAALMAGALMNYTNDSAPLHLASAVNAPVVGIFCSTIPAFGFTPLSDNAHLAETAEELPCRPCGNHGKKSCPKGHFRCSQIAVDELLSKLPQ
jgi:heptosyltransferase-2